MPDNCNPCSKGGHPLPPPHAPGGVGVAPRRGPGKKDVAEAILKFSRRSSKPFAFQSEKTVISSENNPLLQPLPATFRMGVATPNNVPSLGTDLISKAAKFQTGATTHATVGATQ